MKEITKLSATRKQLAAKHFYYNGCECSSCKDVQEAEAEIIDRAADVMIDILCSQSKEEAE